MSEENEKSTEKKKKISFRTVWKLLVLAACVFEFLFSELELFEKETEVEETVTKQVEEKAEADSERNVDLKINEKLPAVVKKDYLQEKLRYIQEKEKLLEVLGEGYENIYYLRENCPNLVVQKKGKWGMVSIEGEVLVPLRYERVSCVDNTGWVEFERNGEFVVYDSAGKLQRIYRDKMKFRMESAEAYLYRTGTAYMSGMKITTIVPEILETDYYGIQYSKMFESEVMYEAIGGYDEAGVYTFPDETGRAVAIRGDGRTNTIYYLTENGCESRVMELPEGINGRWFDFIGDYTWADYSLSHGWLKVMVCDAVPGFLLDDYKYYFAFLNVDTLELVRFPEQYQAFTRMANRGYGNALALTVNDKDETGYYKYAICKGEKVLTEEKYYWVEFGEKYITAGSADAIEILDYEGNVLASYWDVGGVFVNGKMVVSDGTGAWIIDENLEACTDDYLLEGPLDGCFTHGVIVDGLYYPLKELTE